jgi:hypothetical protein
VGEEVLLLLIQEHGTRWGERSASRFSPGERAPGTHCTGGWVGLRAGLDTEVRGKIISPLPGIEPRSLGFPARFGRALDPGKGPPVPNVKEAGGPHSLSGHIG